MQYTEDFDYDASGRHDSRPVGYNKYNPWDLILSERKDLALNLTRQFKAMTRPHVVAINAEWGTGKSLFLKAWGDWLTYEQGDSPLPFFYFNAWENDYEQDAFTAFIGALGRYFTKASESEQWKETAKDWVELFGPMLDDGLALAATGATALFAPPLAPFAGRFTKYHVSKLRTRLEKKEQSRAQFIDKLRAFGEATRTQFDCPLIIMVDELDRCKPSFAIALMESIKHLFSVPGIVFVLALNKPILSSCVAHVYGFDKDSGHTSIMGIMYLDRMLDVTVQLPKYPSDSYLSMMLEQQSFPIKSIDATSFLKLIPDSEFQFVYSDIILEVVQNYASELCLRDINQALYWISLLSHAEGMDILTLAYCARRIFYTFTRGARKTPPEYFNDPRSNNNLVVGYKRAQDYCNGMNPLPKNFDIFKASQNGSDRITDEALLLAWIFASEYKRFSPDKQIAQKVESYMNFFNAASEVLENAQERDNSTDTNEANSRTED